MPITLDLSEETLKTLKPLFFVGIGKERVKRPNQFIETCPSYKDSYYVSLGDFDSEDEALVVHRAITELLLKIQ
jgi:hypothetical protein